MYSADEQARLNALAAAQPNPTRLTFHADRLEIHVVSAQFGQFKSNDTLTPKDLQDAETKLDADLLIETLNDRISTAVALFVKQKAAAEAKRSGPRSPKRRR